MSSLEKERTSFSAVVTDTGGGDLYSDPHSHDHDPTAMAAAALTALQRSGGGDQAKAAFLTLMKTAIDKLIFQPQYPFGIDGKETWQNQ